MAGLIRSFNPMGMSLGELKHWASSGKVSSTVKTMLNAKIAGMSASSKSRPAPAPRAAAAAPAAAAPTPAKQDFSALDAASDKWVEGQHADIDRSAEQNLAQGMSNMIGSGLAGTTAVGGMTAGVGEAATRAKTNVAGQAAVRKEGMKLQYANLAQAASEGAANRAFSASEGAANRSLTASEGSANRVNSLSLGSMSMDQGDGARPSSPTLGLDAFGQPMGQMAISAGGGPSGPSGGSMQSKKSKTLASQPSGPAGGQSGGMGGLYPAIRAAVKEVFSFWS